MRRDIQVLDRVKSAYSSLRPSEQKVADCILDGVPVLKDITLQVADGEIVSILGPSGCGKTTLLNLILGIADVDGGHIRYDGRI